MTFKTMLDLNVANAGEIDLSSFIPAVTQEDYTERLRVHLERKRYRDEAAANAMAWQQGNVPAATYKHVVWCGLKRNAKHDRLQRELGVDRDTAFYRSMASSGSVHF